MNDDHAPDTGRDDPFAPPREPCECWCLHCGRTFMSSGIWFQRVIGDPQNFEGFWMCPTPNCSGAGFTFDIFPTDPDHPGNAGWCDDEDDSEFDFDDDDEQACHGDDAEWDPSESKYAALDERLGDPDDDIIEGDEWKLGLNPGEFSTEPSWAEEARRERDEEERQYNEPDRRPRILDWSDREDRKKGSGGDFNADDIPF